MKKVFIFLGLTVLALNARAQITLEHSFNSQYPTLHFYTDMGIRYCNYNTLNKQLTLYNVDYSVYKVITMNIPADHKFSNILCVSDKLFNRDNLIEFIFVTCSNSGTECSMKLYNENNLELKNFGDRNNAFVISGNGVTKLKVTKVIFGSSNQISYLDEIYSLPGHLYNAITIPKSEDVQPAYPNPTNSTVAIPYVLPNGQTAIMEIYSSNGQLVEQKQIDSNFDRILLNVESYQPGIYFYKYNGVSNRFIVN